MSDRRTLLARADLADARLEGLVRAARFAQAAAMRCILPTAGVMKAADGASMQEDELLYGEAFDVLETKDGWAWGQARRDGYVGFVRAEALAPEAEDGPTLRIAAVRTCGFRRPDLKSGVVADLSMGSLVAPGETQNGFVDAGPAGWIYARHLERIGVFEADPVAVAELFLGAPYVWGARSGLGLDCSGLVQQAMMAVGRACPRDTDQQLAAFPEAVERQDLVRGDLVFWKGHVSMMVDHDRMIHANAHHMAVAIEPLDGALARIEKAGVPFVGYRRP
jgi:cell wall-associated NlpC family hydrolase